MVVTQEGETSRVNLMLKGSLDESYEDFFECSDTFIDAESHDELCDLERCRKCAGLRAGMLL